VVFDRFEPVDAEFPTSFTPLYSGGLCEAVITSPGRPWTSAYRTAAGVGVIPNRATSTPTLASPLAAAFSNISPESRVSRATKTQSADQTVPAAFAIRRTNSGESPSPTTPRVPLDPNSCIGS